MSEKIEVSKEQRKFMGDLIKQFFLNERDEDLGDLSTAVILDFFIRELAPEFYNLGINDAYRYMNDKVDDLMTLQIYKRQAPY